MLLLLLLPLPLLLLPLPLLQMNVRYYKTYTASQPSKRHSAETKYWGRGQAAVEYFGRRRTFSLKSQCCTSALTFIRECGITLELKYSDCNVSRKITQLVFFGSVRRLLVTASVVPSSPILVTLVKEALSSSETSVVTRATWRNIPEDDILHSHRRENLKSYITLTGWAL
jgi:hypothetical protein